MTAQLAPVPFISIEEYLDGEEESEIRHEYANGEVRAMAGATEEHELVVLAIAAELRSHLKGKPCKVTASNLKLKIELNHADLFYYPDAMVWGDSDDNERLYKTRPKVLVEVMSRYKTDHLEKLFVYQQIGSLEEYLIVDQDFSDPKAWIYRRATNWDQELIKPGGLIELPSIGFSIALDGLFEI
ncbi:MAG: Uma2 family endonuclease [Verrucomicrobiales bacterium]|jgi:Uma2 family endonuclease